MNILVVAAHPDDEVLGCGGTINRHVNEGDNVFITFMADGVTSRNNSSDSELEARNESALAACNILGAESIQFLGFPDNRMDTVFLLDIVQGLEKVIEEIKPEAIYTHHSGDLNIDHRITHQAVMTACRPLPDSTVKEIYGFEVLSSTDWATPQNNPFIPNIYIDINNYLSTKLDALEAYKEEMRYAPHSRCLEHVQILARHRGYSVGIEAAEAFVIYRMIR